MSKDKYKIKFKDCPCNTCIVQPICKESCLPEVIWFSSLSRDEKLDYINLGRYKVSMSRDAAEFVVDEYNVFKKHRKAIDILKK
ncbi:MAG: hypothetical protein ACFFG0_00375 [Candidatus Thorarchaeota archaeon]